jgi:hypothetical protein
MATCIICRRDTVLDDVVVLAREVGACVCLRCHERQEGSALPLARKLRKAITAAMDGRA